MLTTQCWHAWQMMISCDTVSHSACDRWYLVTDDCDRWYLTSRDGRQLKSAAVPSHDSDDNGYTTQSLLLPSINIGWLPSGLPELKIGVWVFETQNIFLWNVFDFRLILSTSGEKPCLKELSAGGTWRGKFVFYIGPTMCSHWCLWMRWMKMTMCSFHRRYNEHFIKILQTPHLPNWNGIARLNFSKIKSWVAFPSCLLVWLSRSSNISTYLHNMMFQTIHFLKRLVEE